MFDTIIWAHVVVNSNSFPCSLLYSPSLNIWHSSTGGPSRLFPVWSCYKLYYEHSCTWLLVNKSTRFCWVHTEEWIYWIGGMTTRRGFTTILSNFQRSYTNLQLHHQCWRLLVILNLCWYLTFSSFCCCCICLLLNFSYPGQRAVEIRHGFIQHSVMTNMLSPSRNVRI